MAPAKCNYEIHDKEMLAVIWALSYWRAELQGLAPKFRIYTDHEALKYFGTKQLLNSRQARWSELLSSFNYDITYCPGKLNLLADTLSRKAEDLQTQKEMKQKNQTKTLLSTEYIIAPVEVNLQAELDMVDRILTANRDSDSL